MDSKKPPKVASKSSERIADCPIVLKPFPTFDLKEKCPTLSTLISKQAETLPYPLPTQILQDLEKELETATLLTKQKLDLAKQEWDKLDIWVKHKNRELKKQQQQSNTSNPGTSIKLDLKKIKEIDDLKKNTTDKRKRFNENESETDCKNIFITLDEYSESPAPIRSSNNLKKRQKTKETRELKSQEPSESVPPTEDVKIKPSQQTLITTFYNYVDSYFKQLSDEDLKAIEPSHSYDQSVLIIPPLGKNYKEVWKEEEKVQLPGTEEITAEKKKQNGPLTQRIISAFLQEMPSHASEESDPDSVESISLPPKELDQEQYYDIEERIKNELRYIGLWDEPEELEDEITLELKRLQNHLRKIINFNDRRKEVIKQMAQQRMAYQEYLLILDELNKQVEQAYQKHFKSSQKKKKKSIQKSAPDGIYALLERRKFLIQEFQPILPHEKFLMPEESIFDDEEDDSWLDGIHILPDTDILLVYAEMANKQKLALMPPPPAPIPVQETVPDSDTQKTASGQNSAPVSTSDSKTKKESKEKPKKQTKQTKKSQKNQNSESPPKRKYTKKKKKEETAGTPNPSTSETADPKTSSDPNQSLLQSNDLDYSFLNGEVNNWLFNENF